MNRIRQRFADARKVYGLADEITTPAGVKVRGRYVLTDAGACTPSHNPLNAFRKSEGFPVDTNGQSVNDRDYERDNDAQLITRQIAANYDARALQAPVVVSRDGIVLSGNGRTMAGILAARDNTDAAYVNYLIDHPEKYGMTADDVLSFNNPRLIFVVDDSFPYNAETFAMFNAQEIKSQSKTEQAVKLGKLVDNETFNRIVRSINTFDTIAEFYACTKASAEAISQLQRLNIISAMQLPEMFDGDTISTQAREILENVLIGKAFATSPDTVRKITAFKGMRKNIITALAEISSNIALADYSLAEETINAVGLVYDARFCGHIPHGEIVSGYARQTALFSAENTVADFRNTVTLTIADAINNAQSTRLKKLFTLYNQQASASASGQFDMFSSGGIKTKDEILREVANVFATTTTREQNRLLASAQQQRKFSASVAIAKEHARESMLQQNTITDIPGIPVGSVCALVLPSRERVFVRLEAVISGLACIRLKGWARAKVPASSVEPTMQTALSLPSWAGGDPHKVLATISASEAA